MKPNSTSLAEFKGKETVRCNLCNADETETMFTVSVREDQKGIFWRDEWDIVRCKSCGLVYTNPRPDGPALAAYYRYENPYDHEFVQDWFINNADSQRPTWRRYLNAMKRFEAPGRLLDVGCGAGAFLVEAKRQGYEVVGQEISPFFIDYCRNELGLEIHDSEIEDLSYEAETFDCITAFDVIEHHPDPRKLIDEMHRLLKPGGLSVISTHDIGNPFARLYGKNWRYLNPIGHLTYFDKQTLCRMLSECGFSIVHVSGIHTIDGSRAAELRNWVIQFIRTIIIRSIVIGVYRPLSSNVAALRKWQFEYRGTTFSHKKLLRRAGEQVIMNDDIVILARAER
ncbi:MAG: class I SAM-dependent methyltransferase [Chloroflexota bacterium]|jgi:2-polyprenyl-3-methyl-5-hydroxy-6-metoxy-1,4-benzoquinol methylase